MNVLTNMLSDSSALMMSHRKVMSSDVMRSNHTSLHGPVSQISTMESHIALSSPPTIPIFNTSNHITIPPSLETGFEDQNVIGFSDEFPEIVPSWLTQDFMKVSDGVDSPGIFSNVSQIFQPSGPMELLDMRFPPELTSGHMVEDALQQTCVPDHRVSVPILSMDGNETSMPLISMTRNEASMPILSMNRNITSVPGLSMDRISNNNPILMSSYNMINSSHLESSLKQGPLLESVLPYGTSLLSVASSLAEPCLTSSPSLLSHSHPQQLPVTSACDKLPHINLSHLDSLLNTDTELSSEIHHLGHDFPTIRIEENDSYPSIVSSMSCDTGAFLKQTFPTTQDASVQASEKSAIKSTCLPCSKVGSNVAIEAIECYKCKLCDFVSTHCCTVENHIFSQHSKPKDAPPVENKPTIPTAPWTLTPKDSQPKLANDASRSIVKNNQNHMLTAKSTEDTKQKRTKSQTENSNKKSNKKPNPKRKSPRDAEDTAKDDPDKNISIHKKAWQKKLKRELGTYICEHKGCNVRFRAVDNLEYHLRCHVGGSSKSFACPECGSEFGQWSSIAGHLWRTHHNDMELHACDKCSFRTYFLGRLENYHKRIHQAEFLFLCDKCGKGFKNPKQLRNHNARHLQNEQKQLLNGCDPANALLMRFRCTLCPTDFGSKKELRLHRELVHNIQPKVLRCNQCEFTTFKNSLLENHIRIHTGEKPFKCEECAYRATDHNSLRKHKMTHSGEKKYKCPYCSYTSIQAISFKNHVSKQHPEQEGLLYSCTLCPYKTVKKKSHVEHMKQHECDSVSPGGNEINYMEEVFPFAEAMGIGLSNCDSQSAYFNLMRTKMSALVDATTFE